MKLIIYYHTLRYVKIIQLINRVIRKFKRISTSLEKKPFVRDISGAWDSMCIAEQSMFDDGSVCFLNEMGGASDWNNPEKEKLWLYNLHYFEDLVSISASDRAALHRALIDRWIDENCPLNGNGWEPYPLSLRIVNWIKWLNNGGAVSDKMNISLSIQVHVLSQCLEYHLLGNHLFANGKALVFSGLYFEGELADFWLKKGLEILDREMVEQVCDDGGNFELSPMYHSIMLHDVLDLINLSKLYNHLELSRRLPRWSAIARKMLYWLGQMSHPDGDIAFFNDSAIGIAPSLKRLKGYALSLGVAGISKEKIGGCGANYVYLRDTGYIRVNSGAITAILDVAKIGPDYIPGHGHADTLSFELSVGNQRVFVNSGTSVYGLTEERLRQRKTSAHNTVEVDEQDSSQVWSGFRVARRAYPTVPTISQADGIDIDCSHDGYRRLPGRNVHRRRWHFGQSECVISDVITGKFNYAEAHLHIHPEIEVSSIDSSQCELVLATGQKVKLTCQGGVMTVQDGTWHPRFGVVIKNRKLTVKFSAGDIAMRITY